MDPRIVLYDEPTTGLDPITTNYVEKVDVDKVMGGAGMCVHQAVDAFRLFSGGVEADRQRMHRTFDDAARRRDALMSTGST